MSAAKHTPAPWVALPYDENAGYDCMYPGVRIESATGLKIVVVDEGDYLYSHDDRPDMRPLVEANARLIASAPAFYDWAVKAIARKHRGQVFLDYEDVIDLENIIAKAEVQS